MCIVAFSVKHSDPVLEFFNLAGKVTVFLPVGNSSLPGHCFRQAIWSVQSNLSVHDSVDAPLACHCVSIVPLFYTRASCYFGSMLI